MVKLGTMRIANPIYDAAFKYLLDDNRQKLTRNPICSCHLNFNRCTFQHEKPFL